MTLKRILVGFLGVVLSLLLVLAAVIGWLGFTTSGARWLVGWFTPMEPRLSFEITGGALAHGLRLKDLAWRQDGLTATAAEAEIAYTLECLTRRQICLDQVSLAGVRVNIEERPEQAAPADAAPPAPLNLPAPIRLQLLQVRDAVVATPGFEARLASLQTTAGLEKNTLTVGWARLRGFALTLRDDGEPPKPIEFPLPTVDLPLDLKVDGVLLEDARIATADRVWLIDSAALNADLVGSELALRQLQVNLADLRAETQGQLTLSGDYPLSLQLRGVASDAALPSPVELSGKLAGSLRTLAVQAQLQGGVELSASGQVEPLNRQFPFQLEARTPRLSWPLAGEAQVSVRDALLNAQGDRSNYRLSLLAEVGGRHFPTGRWRAQAEGDPESLRIGRALGEVLGGEVEVSGQLDWRTGFGWQVRAVARGVDPGRYWKGYPGHLSGEVQVEGLARDGDYRLALRTDNAAGRLRGYPLAVQGSVRKELKGGWLFENLRLASGPNRISVDGALDDQVDLQGRFDLPKLAALLPEIEGGAQGSFRLTGAPDLPNVKLNLTAHDLKVEGAEAGQLAVDAELRRLGFGQSRITWTGEKVVAGGQSLGTVTGRLTGIRADHELQLAASGGDFGGELTLAGALSPRYDWRGRLERAVLTAPPSQRWELAEATPLAWRQRQTRLSVAAHCWRQQAAELCFTEPAEVGTRGQLAARLRGFQIEWLAAWMPDGVVWTGPLAGDASIAWQPGQPLRLTAEAASTEGKVQLTQDDETAPLRLDYQRIAARLGMGPDSVALDINLDSRTLGAGSVNLRTAARGRPRGRGGGCRGNCARVGVVTNGVAFDTTLASHPGCGGGGNRRTAVGGRLRALSGQVSLNGLRLEILKPFLPQVHTLNGAVAAEGRFGGTLSDPRFVGRVSLADGRLGAPNLPVPLTEVSLTADVQGPTAKLTGSFASGGGKGALNGEARWGGERWALDFALTGERLLFEYPPVARLRINPDLKVRVEPKRVDVQGRVVVPSGQITLDELPEGAVAVSDDVVVVRRPDTPAGPSEANAPAGDWRVTTDIELVLGDQVALSGRGLTGRLAGSLRVRQRPQSPPEAVGELRIVDGRYKAYGQDLVIRQGVLLFSGPVKEPALNVEAVRTVETVVAGIRVEGRPETPRVSLFSEPDLPQEDILSYIIRGRPLREGGGDQTQQQLVAQAALALGIFGGKGFASSLAQQIGIEDFEVGTRGEGETTQFELSGYLATNLYVRYGIGVFTPVNTLTLRYRLSPSFYVEAMSGLESALDVFYEFQY